MRYLRQAFDLYINSSIHVALAVVCFAMISMLEYNFKITYELLAFIFLSTITGYNFVKFAGIAKLHHSSLAGNLRIIQIFSFISFLTLIYFALQLSVNVLIATAILGLLTLLYALPVFGKSRNLRSLAGIKIFVIAMVWAGTTVLLPVINAQELLNQPILIDFFQRFCLVVVLTLPFEIRDLVYDSNTLETIPQRIGVRKTRLFGIILLTLIVIIEIFQQQFRSYSLLSLFLVCIILGVFLLGSRERQSKYYASFWVELIPIIYLGILLITKYVLPNVVY
ncbi:hypothetical protein JM79_0680 [Gramella sp. Hel_I_59]|uniref:hypothetical protein n=1 Tax=Gramella sp. Hel_I_59 TaxID=1249978 RepID=UPI00115340A9|nr:hypothetical protein [Gramella sp. Hel_I_59]TQI69787.1 hypothetical protein JM79_0680 [Gramella sp. Hel_I_59]